MKRRGRDGDLCGGRGAATRDRIPRCLRCALRVQGLGFGVKGVGCRAYGAWFEKSTDDEVTVDDLMEVGSRLMHLAVQKHPACRGPQLNNDNCTVVKNEKRKEEIWNSVLIFRPLLGLRGGEWVPSMSGICPKKRVEY